MNNLLLLRPLEWRAEGRVMVRDNHRPDTLCKYTITVQISHIHRIVERIYKLKHSK